MSAPTPVSQYVCVILEMYGSSDNALFIYSKSQYGNLKSRDVFLNDPDNPEICVQALDADAELRERCGQALLVFAWVPSSLAAEAELKLHIEPARPPASDPS